MYDSATSYELLKSGVCGLNIDIIFTEFNLTYKNQNIKFRWFRGSCVHIEGMTVDCLNPKSTLETFITSWKNHIDDGIMNYPHCIDSLYPSKGKDFSKDGYGFYIP